MERNVIAPVICANPIRTGRRMNRTLPRPNRIMSKEFLIYLKYRFASDSMTALKIAQSSHAWISKGIAVSVVLLTATIAAHAASGFEEDFDDTDKPWQEVAV